jgi:hypothetical protein
MELFDFISKYFWLVAIVFTEINFFIFKKRAEKHIKENPGLAEGYSVLLHGYLFWMNIPWITMGVDCTIGGIPNLR